MKRLAAYLVVALLAMSAIVGAVGNTAVNYDAAPNPYVEEQRLDKATHNMSSMDALEYSNDSGAITQLPAHLNDSVTNQFRVDYAKVEADGLRKFPRELENRNAVEDHANWTTSGVTVSESATDVEGVQISGTNGTATWSEVSLNDANKRVLLVAGNVNSIDTGATVEIRAVGDDGDYKAVSWNETGTGYVSQSKLAELAVNGSGDGSLDAIENVKVVISGGAADVAITGLDAERKSKVLLGQIEKDTDSDDENETIDLYEIDGGEQKLTTLASMGDTFDDAVIHDLGIIGVHYAAADAASDNVNANYMKATEYGSYPSKLDQHARLRVPAAIDLTHHGLTLKAEQKFVNDRQIVVELAEGVGGG